MSKERIKVEESHMSDAVSVEAEHTPKKAGKAEPQELKRGIKGWQTAFLGLAGAMGSSFFLGLGVIVHDMGPSVLFAFAACGLILYGLMMSYGELLVNVPRKGSFVAYTNEFLGETVSVGLGWAFWFNWVVYIPSEAIAVAMVLNALHPGNQVFYACGALLILTVINLTAVDIFAKIESTLALIKIASIVLFVILAFAIWVGLWGNEGYLGASVNFGSGDLLPNLFPNGYGIVLTTMVIVLISFQGTEIVGLAAAETENPEKAVPLACRSVTIRILLLYMLPILLIVLIFPTQLASLEDSVFAQVMHQHGLSQVGAIMSGVVLIAAFSCANTGFYGTVRCMYGLSIEGLAPIGLSKLNRNAVPMRSVLFTVVFMWIVLIIGLFAGKSRLYESLLNLSGFTGTVAWIGIIASQIVFRKRLKARGYDPYEVLKAPVKKSQRWIPTVSMLAQSFFLLVMAFGEGQFIIFLIACAALVLPMAVHRILKKSGKTRDVATINTGETPFDVLFPPKS